MRQKRNAAQRLRSWAAAVKLAFTWLGVRKTLAPEQNSSPTEVRATYLKGIREG
jgi:hypothetical protein